jgi:hypothetical protein
LIAQSTPIATQHQKPPSSRNAKKPNQSDSELSSDDERADSEISTAVEEDKESDDSGDQQSTSQLRPLKKRKVRHGASLVDTIPSVLVEYFALFGIVDYGDFMGVGITSKKAFKQAIECTPKGFSDTEANAVRLAAHLALERIAKELRWK